MTEALLSVELQHRLPELQIDVTFAGTSGRFALFGPSGAGKTTILKAIAGLVKPDAAKVSLGNQVWEDATTSLPAYLRGAVFVFQDDRLFPHMSMMENLTYGQKDNASAALPRLIEMTGISALLDRSVHTLSGGERKRIAIARALAASPSLLLLDEPYAGLDRATAQRLRRDLRALLAEMSVVHILVSHQLDDVLAHAEEVVLIEDGKAIGFGAPEAVFETPTGQRLIGHADETLAAGPMSILRVTKSSHAAGEGLCAWQLANGARLILASASGQDTDAAYVRIRGADVSLALSHPTDTSVLNVMEASIVELTPAADFMDVRLDLGAGLFLSARITSYSASHLGLAPGQSIYAMIKSAALTH